jgi:RsiW-degrading membrane proteinase PrsW (M82 family)/pSer/pThr/pTyr-binding forkhead associated (FHA) protein
MSVMQNYGVLRVVRGNHGSQEKTPGAGSSMEENSTDRALELEQAVGPRHVEVGLVSAQSLGVSKKRIKLGHKYLGRWLPEERLVHVLSQRETTIGRALSSDIILLDQTVSRDHARLVLGEHGWFVQNVTENNVVRVNDQIVSGGAWSSVQPQDLLVIGNTTLQLVAPLPDSGSLARIGERSNEDGAEQNQSLWSSVTLQFAFSRLLQYPRTDRENGAKSLSSPVPANVADSDEAMSSMFRTTVPLQSPSFALSDNARRFFIVGGLLSLVVVVVLLLLSSLNRLFGLVQDGAYNLFLAFVVSFIPALGINVLMNFIDRYEREPWFLRLAAFLWGAIIAIPPALFIESFIDGFITHLWGGDSQVVSHAFLSGLGAGITEETVKGLGLLLLFFILRDEFDNITDGIVYGALIGAGFAMVENVFYFLRNPNDMSALIIGRIILGWLSHSTFTVCFGVALGYIRHTRVRWRHSIVPLSGYLLAVGLHTIFDFVDILVRDMVPAYGNSPTVARFAILAVVGNYIPPFIVQVGILYILVRSLIHETKIIRDFLPSEVASGVVTVDEYVLLSHSFVRTRLERRVLWRYGIKQWLLTKALYQTEIGLAFRKWHVSMGDKPKLGYLQPEMAYRKRIKRIREEIAALETRRLSTKSFSQTR